MSVQYEFWLTDDSGKRLSLLKDFSFVNYVRAVSSLGPCMIGMPFEPFAKVFNPWFRPDWRLEVWRSPAYGIPMRREDVYLLRKPNVYTRADTVEMIQFNGRNGIDILNRRHVIQRSGTEWATKTDLADDMMKAIVREQMLFGSVVDEDGIQDNTRAWPENEFSVQADISVGPSITKDFAGKNVFAILKDIKATTFQLFKDASTNKRIFFDVVPDQLSANSNSNAAPLGWKFITKAELYGVDRRGNLEFSKENENIKTPNYSISHLDEINSVYVNGGGRGDTQITQVVEDSSRLLASRWNRIEGVTSAASETTATSLQDKGRAELEKKKPREDFPVIFLNTPGSGTTPQSLYGINWDLGDLLSVNYAQQQFNVEVNVVYVAVNDQGVETITGRNEVSNAI